MEKSVFKMKFDDKTYEGKGIEELCKAPVSAIGGVSESDVADLKKALGIETVEDARMFMSVLDEGRDNA